MVSGSVITEDLNSLLSSLKSYSSEITNLNSGWQGLSHDNIISQAENFVSEYQGTISGEMNAFAQACNLYEEYKLAKKNLVIAEENYNTAIANNDSKAINDYSELINTYKEKIDTLTTDINSNLQTASATTLTATQVQLDSITIPNTNSQLEVTQSPATGKNRLKGKNIIDTSQVVEYGKKYNLSNKDLAYLGYVAMKEQGSVEGAKLELSLMCNLYEKNKKKYKNVRDYVVRSEWFSPKSLRGYRYPGDKYVEAARDVLNEGNHYVTSDIVEHDCIGDIAKISTGSKNNRNNYIPGKTVIYNEMGARYVFIGFAPHGGDPFGYEV